MMKRVLITGGCGFIGSHVIKYILINTDWEIIVIDKLNYASSGFDRLKDFNIYSNPRVKIYTTDFTKSISTGIKKEIGDVNYILHMGAETHVDNSITDPVLFANVNAMGTLYMLEYARQVKGLELFLYFSTDEVQGSAPKGVYYKETDMNRPENPYAAAKSAGESFCTAYACTYKLPLIITRTMNVFSSHQHHEKFIPGTIRKILLNEEVIIHASSNLKIASSRFYISAENVAKALDFIIENGELHTKENREQGIYNIVGEKEIDNLYLVKAIYSNMQKIIKNLSDLKYTMTDFHRERPGHDLRYALDGSKLKGMGLEYPKNFEQSLNDTVRWYLNNKKWLGL